jgi:hypothetical protein
MNISPTSIVVAGKDQVTSDVAGEAVILHMRSGRYYGLAQVGARIWHLISEPKRVSEIRDAIVQEYDVAVDRCERDVVTLLEEMAEQGLVEVRSDAK